MNPESSVSAVRQRWCSFVCCEQAARLPDAEGWLGGAKVWNTCWQTQVAKLEAEECPRQRKKNTYTKSHVFYIHVKKDRDMTNEWQWQYWSQDHESWKNMVIPICGCALWPVCIHWITRGDPQHRKAQTLVTTRCNIKSETAWKDELW